VVAALDEMKAVNIKVLDVRGLADFADTMIVASGNSDRHVRAIAQHVVERARERQQRPMGVEGTRDGEWVLVDLQDVVVHLMLPRVREFYAIEQLWEQAPPLAVSTAAPRAAAAPAPKATTGRPASGASRAQGVRRPAAPRAAAPRTRRARTATR
jgi:ribosome-associated protein